jgi:hypothetical protein
MKAAQDGARRPCTPRAGTRDGRFRFTFALQGSHLVLTGLCIHASMRRLWLGFALCAALVVAAPGAATPHSVDRGIIVRVRPPVLVLRELDGSRMRFRINPTTIVKLDGRRVRLRRLQRGDVAVVVHDGDFVLRVRAFRP